MLFHFLFFKIEFSKQLVPNLSRNLISKGLPLRMKGIGEKSTASLKKIRFTSGIGLSLSDSKVHFVRFSKGRGGGEKGVKISRRLNIYLRRKPWAAAAVRQGWQGARQGRPKDRNRYRNCRPRRSCTSLSPMDPLAISSLHSRAAAEPLGFRRYP